MNETLLFIHTGCHSRRNNPFSVKFNQSNYVSSLRHLLYESNLLHVAVVRSSFLFLHTYFTYLFFINSIFALRNLHPFSIREMLSIRNNNVPFVILFHQDVVILFVDANALVLPNTNTKGQNNE